MKASIIYLGNIKQQFKYAVEDFFMLDDKYCFSYSQKEVFKKYTIPRERLLSLIKEHVIVELNFGVCSCGNPIIKKNSDRKVLSRFIHEFETEGELYQCDSCIRIASLYHEIELQRLNYTQELRKLELLRKSFENKAWNRLTLQEFKILKIIVSNKSNPKIVF